MGYPYWLQVTQVMMIIGIHLEQTLLWPPRSTRSGHWFATCWHLFYTPDIEVLKSVTLLLPLTFNSALQGNCVLRFTGNALHFDLGIIQGFHRPYE